VSRLPVASERLTLTASGQVRYALRTPYRDGTTHIVLESVDFIAWLAALPLPPAGEVDCAGQLLGRSHAVVRFAERGARQSHNDDCPGGE
jgi:hypothetical protein